MRLAAFGRGDTPPAEGPPASPHPRPHVMPLPSSVVNLGALVTACVGLTAAIPAHLCAQNTGLPKDGPITVRAYDAAYIRDRLATNDSALVRAKIREAGPAGENVLVFVETPITFLTPAQVLPTPAELAAAREAAKNPRGAAVSSFAAGPRAAGEASVSRESAFLLGLASFVITRTKVEFIAAALRQSQLWFRHPTAGPVLEDLFSTTSVLVKGTESVTPEVLPVLRSAVRQDLQRLPTATWAVVDARCRRPQPPNASSTPTVSAPNAPSGQAAAAGDRKPCTDARYDGGIDALRVVAAVGQSVVRRESPVATFAALDSIPRVEFRTDAGYRMSRAMSTVAGEIAPGNGRRFIDALGDPRLMEYTAVVFARTVADKEVRPLIADSLLRRVRPVLNAARAVQDVAEEFEALRDDRDAPMSERRQRYAALARGFATATARVGDAGLAFTSLSAPARFTEMVTTLSDLAVSVVDEDYVTTAALTLAGLEQAGLPLDARVARWVPFAGALAAAKTSGEVEPVLEQFALPPASYIGKRYPAAESSRKAAVYLNAYLGASGGGEWLNGRGADRSGGAGYVGAALPIGVEVSFRQAARSVFVSLLDLGAVASYRLGDGQTDPSPNVTFANVIAPGVFVTTSLTKAFPMALGFGWQYAPKLRSVALTSGAEVKRDASRVGVFVASDIPLFRFR